MRQQVLASATCVSIAASFRFFHEFFGSSTSTLLIQRKQHRIHRLADISLQFHSICWMEVSDSLRILLCRVSQGILQLPGRFQHVLAYVHEVIPVKVQNKCTLWRLSAAEVSHQLRSTFGDESAFFSKFFSIGNSVIRIIRCAESWEFVCMCHPVKFAAIDDRTAERCPCPSIYLVVECVTISAPHSIGRKLTGVGKVLSTMSGTPCACAAFANFSISRTVSAGLAIDSPKTALVFSLKAAFNSSSVQSGSTKVTSTPIFFIVTARRL